MRATRTHLAATRYLPTLSGCCGSAGTERYAQLLLLVSLVPGSNLANWDLEVPEQVSCINNLSPYRLSCLV